MVTTPGAGRTAVARLRAVRRQPPVKCSDFTTGCSWFMGSRVGIRVELRSRYATRLRSAGCLCPEGHRPTAHHCGFRDDRRARSHHHQRPAGHYLGQRGRRGRASLTGSRPDRPSSVAPKRTRMPPISAQETKRWPRWRSAEDAAPKTGLWSAWPRAVSIRSAKIRKDRSCGAILSTARAPCRSSAMVGAPSVQGDKHRRRGHVPRPGPGASPPPDPGRPLASHRQ